MKRIKIGLLFLILATSTFAQQVQITPAKKRAILLDKASGEKTTGWLLIGLGGAAIIGSYVAVVSAGPSGKGPPPTPVIPLVLGVGSLIGGTIVLGSGIKHEKEAMEISAHFNFQPVQTFNYSAESFRYYPALTLKARIN